MHKIRQLLKILKKRKAKMVHDCSNFSTWVLHITKCLKSFQNLKALYYIPIFCLLFHFVWMDKERQYLTSKIFWIRYPTSNYCECGLAWPTSAWGSLPRLAAAVGLRTEAARHLGNPWEGAGHRAGQRRAACSVCLLKFI